jgi:hypothetical protein
MSTLRKNADVRLFGLGMKVRRAAAQPPNATTGDLFTVTGGRIKVYQLIGEYTVAPGAVANTILAKYLASAAGSSAAAWSIASIALTSAIVSTHLWLPSAAASAMSSDMAAPKGWGGPLPLLSYVVPPGKVQILTGGNQTAARIQWDLYYVPVDVGAAVAAA